MDGSMGTLKSAHMRSTAPLEGRISTNLQRSETKSNVKNVNTFLRFEQK